jgi:DNA-binding MarR family transcriptional regulator
MKRISNIGSLLKKIYRSYSNDLLDSLQQKGFIDLRPSFLEILMYVCDHEAPSIKMIGMSCGLKKQTMTSHLNELEKRGYILRKTGENDRREQKVHLTEYGQRFKITLLEVINDLEADYLRTLGEVELDRIVHMLENFHNKMQHATEAQQSIF